MKRNVFIEWAGKKYPLKTRLAAMIPLGLIFVAVIPYFLVRTAGLDHRLNIPRLHFEPYNLIIAAVLLIIGVRFAFWSISYVFSEGEGTPAPMMPTQKLIWTGPFRYCRNPMAFGTVCAAYGGSSALY